MDVHSPEQRSFNMSRIKGKNTKPEIKVRKWLWSQGYRYRLHKKDLPGKPDIVFPGLKKAIYIHGCFWHKHDCKYFKWPGTNTDFWKEKITRTVIRDQQNRLLLADRSWNCFTVWECELKDNTSDIFDRIKLFIDTK